MKNTRFKHAHKCVGSIPTTLRLLDMSMVLYLCQGTWLNINMLLDTPFGNVSIPNTTRSDIVVFAIKRIKNFIAINSIVINSA